MKIQAIQGSIEKASGQLLVISVSSDEIKKPKKKGKGGYSLADLEHSTAKEIMAELTRADFKVSPGQSCFINLLGNPNWRAALIIGWGSNADSAKSTLFEKVSHYRKLGSLICDHAKRRGMTEVVLSSHNLDLKSEANLRALIEGVLLSGYSFEKYKSKRDNDSKRIETLSLLGLKSLSSKVVADSINACEATCYARDLINTPPRDCTPGFLASECKKIAKKEGLKIDVFDAKALKKMGAGALLAVAQGSSEPPYLIRMVYSPKRKSKKILSLIGKGVTFDSGGLSIKTGSGMETMKCDMSGAAAVMAVMSICSKIKPDYELRAYIPTTENMINGQATRPGDVVAAMSGKTIEILNTDAEGRLILADAITLAERDKSDIIIDLATLTGACMVALGTDYAGLFSNDDQLAEKLIRAGEQAGEHLWRMPLVKEYKDWIKSSVGDIKNLGKPFGGAITGALFLEEFVDKARWAHLDIAGTAFTDGDNGHIRKGGVGFGVRTLLGIL